MKMVARMIVTKIGKNIPTITVPDFDVSKSGTLGSEVARLGAWA